MTEIKGHRAVFVTKKQMKDLWIKYFLS